MVQLLVFVRLWFCPVALCFIHSFQCFLDNAVGFWSLCQKDQLAWMTLLISDHHLCHPFRHCSLERHIFVFRFIFLLKQNYLSRGCFCLLHYRDHHLCRTLQFTKKCICFTICWCRYHSISQHNTTVLLYHATLKSIRPPHSAQEADSSRQPCYEQDVKGENIWKISIYPKYLTNIIKRWLRRTNPKIVIRTPADRVHKISTKW